MSLFEKPMIVNHVIENSSNIIRVGYDAPTQIMEVEFLGGSLYRYAAVPETVVNEFLDAKSKGSFFALRIKGKFESEKFVKEAK